MYLWMFLLMDLFMYLFISFISWSQERALEARNQELEAQLEHANKRASKAKRLAKVAVGGL